MAKVVLIGVEPTAAEHIKKTLTVERHEVESRPAFCSEALPEADIVFAGGAPEEYLSLLKRVREEKPGLPFVVVTRLPETREWLDALEAGATDYCSAPVETRQIQWMMQTALPRPRTFAA